MFGAIHFVKITKESLYKANSLACFLAQRDTPVAATLQRKKQIFWWNHLVIITKLLTIDSKRDQKRPFREQPRGVENSGGWKTYRKFGEKPLPQKRFWTPPPTIRFPPPFWRLSVISLKRKRHRPDQPQFLRPPKVVLEGTESSTFSPPPKFTRYVCPPIGPRFPLRGPLLIL